ncbi:MAG: hypothetical protein ACREDG_00915 [Methylocella sp.]
MGYSFDLLKSSHKDSSSAKLEISCKPSAKSPNEIPGTANQLARRRCARGRRRCDPIIDECPVYTGGRSSVWPRTAIPRADMTAVMNVAGGAAKTARHPEAAKKEVETIGTRRRKAISTEEIRRRARIFF